MTAALQELSQFLERDPYRTPRRGDVLDGKVVRIGRDGVWVDIAGKTEGVILLQEMYSLGPDPLRSLAIGDEVTVYVLQMGEEEGQILLSLDRARGERGWRTAQRRFEREEVFEAPVVSFNKGGLLVEVDGVQGFIPTSHVVGLRSDGGERQDRTTDLTERVGRQVWVKIIEMNRRRNRLILSERLAMQEWQSQQKERLLGELKEGEIRRGRVSSISPFGVFVDLGGADGLVHLSELSWDRSKSPEELLRVGEQVDVYVLKVDLESKRIALSLRRARADSWGDLIAPFYVGQSVQGIVTKLASFGAFVRINEALEGLIHISELADRRINHPREVVAEGDQLTLTIVRIEPERHRLGLSLRQALEEFPSRSPSPLEPPGASRSASPGTTSATFTLSEPKDERSA